MLSCKQTVTENQILREFLSGHTGDVFLDYSDRQILPQCYCYTAQGKQVLGSGTLDNRFSKPTIRIPNAPQNAYSLPVVLADFADNSPEKQFALKWAPLFSVRYPDVQYCINIINNVIPKLHNKKLRLGILEYISDNMGRNKDIQAAIPASFKERYKQEKLSLRSAQGISDDFVRMLAMYKIVKSNPFVGIRKMACIELYNLVEKLGYKWKNEYNPDIETNDYQLYIGSNLQMSIRLARKQQEQSKKATAYQAKLARIQQEQSRRQRIQDALARQTVMDFGK